MVGTGAVRVHPKRAASSQIVDLNGWPILIDCGRCAVQNMEAFGYPPESIRQVLLTHLHFDHVSDLPLLTLLSWNNGRKETLPILGPKGTADFMEFGVRKAYEVDIADRVGHGKSAQALEWEVTEIEKEGLVLERDDCRISALETAHGSLMTSWHFRFETPSATVVVTGDTQMDERLADFARDADLLVIECSGTGEFLKTVPWGHYHITPEQVGALAEAAAVKKVILKHLVVESWTDDPDISAKMAAEVVRRFSGEVLVGEDGMRFDYHSQPEARP